MPDYLVPHWHRAALVVIDMQRDFVDGPQAVPGSTQIVDSLSRLLTAFRAAGRPIVHVIRLYSPGGADVDPVRRDAVESGALIAAPGSVGAQITRGLLPSEVDLDVENLLKGAHQEIGPREIVLYKPRWSAFYRTDLERWLLDNNCDTVVVAGCNLPNCPRATLFDASERDFRAVLVTDAVSQATVERLADLDLIGVRTLTTSDIAAELSVDRRGVALYPFGPEFAADSFAQMTPTLTRYMSWEPPASLAEFEPIWHRWIEDRSAGTDYVFAVTDPDSGEFLGQVGVHQANTDVPELGIWIREDRHGLGYGRKAVAAARDWANEQRDNVVAFRYPVAEDNIASRRIAEGLGGVVVDRYAGDKFPVAVYQIPVEQ